MTTRLKREAAKIAAEIIEHGGSRERWERAERTPGLYARVHKLVVGTPFSQQQALEQFYRRGDVGLTTGGKLWKRPMRKTRYRGLGAIRTYDNGAFYSVAFGEREIHAFRRTWPGSGLSMLRSIWAQFDRRNGDLVDLNCNSTHGSCEPYDGPALSELTVEMQCAATRGRTKARAPKDHCQRSALGEWERKYKDW